MRSCGLLLSHTEPCSGAQLLSKLLDTQQEAPPPYPTLTMQMIVLACRTLNWGRGDHLKEGEGADKDARNHDLSIA